MLLHLLSDGQIYWRNNPLEGGKLQTLAQKEELINVLVRRRRAVTIKIRGRCHVFNHSVSPPVLMLDGLLWFFFSPTVCLKADRLQEFG